MNALSQGAYPETDVKLYDRFLRYVERYTFSGTNAQRELAIARLRLVHPAHPSSDAAEYFLRKTFEGKTAEDLLQQGFWPEHGAVKFMFSRVSRTAIRVARKNGKDGDAAWLESKASELVPPERQRQQYAGRKGTNAEVRFVGSRSAGLRAP
ncbi:hypothetical protein LTR85_004096 [Meristemomyces frigidus]|nr:hypothetical protein LTR85_004096 [Meristemomyces frigidus]